MGNYPLVDFGAPGPLVHLVEKFYPDYLKSLLSALKAKPSLHMLWMVNRVLNSEHETVMAKDLILALKDIAKSKKHLNAVKKEAQTVLERHQVKFEF